MELNNVEIRVLVKGKPITEYAHNGNFFVEGREQSEFEIELQNRNSFRVEMIVTVDGLSVIDGKEGSLDSSGYLLEARQTLRVPGWKLDNEQAAKFVFSGKGGSYATQMTGSSRNNGVIGAMVFAERNRRPVTKVRQRPAPAIDPNQIWINGQPPIGQPWAGGYVPTTTSGTLFGVSKGLDFGYTENLCDATSTISAAPSRMMFGAVASASATPQNSAHPRTMEVTLENTRGATMDWMESEQERGSHQVEDYYFSPGDRGRSTHVQSLNNLGTGFGNATSFETETVAFDRGDLLGVLVIYYDNAVGLRQRGIQVGRPRRVKHTAQTPQAFPGLQKSCTPPPGWKG
jgi:hypothetical protein